MAQQRMRHAKHVVLVTDHTLDQDVSRRTAVGRKEKMSAHHRQKQATSKGNLENFGAAPAAGS